MVTGQVRINVEIQFNEAEGQTVAECFTKSDWPFDGKDYGGRINVRVLKAKYPRRTTSPFLKWCPSLSPLFCLC